MRRLGIAVLYDGRWEVLSRIAELHVCRYIVSLRGVLRVGKSGRLGAAFVAESSLDIYLYRDVTICQLVFLFHFYEMHPLPVISVMLCTVRADFFGNQ